MDKQYIEQQYAQIVAEWRCAISEDDLAAIIWTPYINGIHQ